MAQYNPKTVFRQTSNPLLQRFFENQDHQLPIAWDSIGNTQIQCVYDEYLKLPDSRRCDLEVDLHDVHAVARSDDGVALLVEKSGQMGHDIADQLAMLDSRYDKAMTVLLEHPQVWNEAVPLIHASSLSKRYWYRRNSLPKQPYDHCEATIDLLKRDLSSFYWQSEGRGQLCRVDHIQRSEKLDYFFVYLSDHADTDLTWDDAGNWQQVRSRHAFEVVYVFDHASGVLDVYAIGGKKVVQSLQEIFAKAVLGIDLDPEDDTISYHVDGLKSRSFSFVTDPEDRVSQVAIRMLRMSPRGNPAKKISVKLLGDGSPDDIYVSLENDLNDEKLSPNLLRVERATIVMKLEGYGRKKMLTFDIGPKSCTLKSLPDQFRKLGEKYLQKWGIDRA